MFRSHNVPRDYNNKTNWHHALKQFDVPNDTNKAHQTRNSSKTDKTLSISFNRWAPRLAVLAGCVAILGNIPLQSKPSIPSAISYATATEVSGNSSGKLNSPNQPAKLLELPEQQAFSAIASASSDKESSLDTLISTDKLENTDTAEVVEKPDTLHIAEADSLSTSSLEEDKQLSIALNTDTTQYNPESLTDDNATENNVPVDKPSIKVVNLDQNSSLNESNIDLEPGKLVKLTKELKLPPISKIQTFSVEKSDHKKQTSLSNRWATYIVKPKDNSKKIARRLKVRSQMDDLFDNNDIKKRFARIKPGYILRAKKLNGNLAELVIHKPGNKKSYVIKKTKSGFKGQFRNKIIEVRQSRKIIYITNSWRFNANKDKISPNLINQINDIFDRDVNLSKDLSKGDRVTLVFEEVFHEGEKVASTNILAAELIHNNRTHRALRHVFADGRANYYTPKGMDLNRAFIRHPVSYPRVTSHFSYRRFHPILRRFRPHKGVDYGLPRGTKVKATGNGIVKFAGRKGGYGKTIIIRHSNGYTTSYSHLNGYAKGIRSGKKVYMGDLIGYVGNTGRSTGPHLHYEFRKNGKPYNPIKVKLPRTVSLTRNELAKFKNSSHNLVLQLNVLQRFAEAELDITSGYGG